MAIRFLLKNGFSKVLTMSYDDGNFDGDKRLIEIFNKYGIKGTFHLNGIKYVEGPHGRLADKVEEVKKLYVGHEISLHGYSHPSLARLPKSEVIREIVRDREVLEGLAGYPIRGMSYPFGSYNEEVMEVLKMLDVKYSRGVWPSNDFSFPKNFLDWAPTGHHGKLQNERLEKFAAAGNDTNRIFYIWGHSYEFNEENTEYTWEMMEAFCERASKIEGVWFATNIEIYDYITATKRIEISQDRKMFFNPSAISVWANVDGQAYELKPGVTKI